MPPMPVSPAPSTASLAPAATTQTTVLVVGRGLYALQLARVHSQAGCKVLLATTAAMDFTRASLAVAASFVVPKPECANAESQRAYSSELQRIILEHDVSLVVPAAEEALFVARLLPEWHSALGKRTRVLSGDFPLMQRLHNKYEFQQLCVSAGLGSPPTVLVRSAAEARKAMQASSSAFKFVIKPVFTRGGLAMRIVQRDDDVSAMDFSSMPHVVQDFIAGDEFSSYSVVANGHVLAHVCYACSFQLGGFSTVRTAENKPAILDWVSRFVAHFNFSGQLGFDFIESRDGAIFPLECNPRATNGVSFFAVNPVLAPQLAKAQSNAAAAAHRHVMLRASSSSSTEPAPAPATPTPNRVFSASPGPRASAAVDVVVEPPVGSSVATLLPALAMIRSQPAIIAALKSSSADIEWLSDPFPLLAALGKSLHLAVTSARLLIVERRSFAAMAAQATADELVKFDASIEPPPPPPKSPQAPPSKDALDLASARILVTGATGFLGSHVVRALLQRGCKNVVATGRNRDAFAQFDEGACEFAACDLHDRSAVKKLVAGVDVIVHCAAMCAPWGLLADFVRDNVEATQFLIDAACAPPPAASSSCERALKRFVHISSPSVSFAVDAGPRVAVRETDPLPPASKQSNTYTLTKLMAEHVVNNAAAAYPQTCFVTLRPRAIYGPGDRALFPRIVERLRQSRLPQIGNGSTVVDLTHVSNVAHAVLLACEADARVCAGKTYNVTDCDPQKLWEVIRLICDELYMPRPRFTLPRAVAFYAAYALELAYGVVLKAGINTPEPLLTRYAVNVLSTSQTLDCSAAQRDLGYAPVVSTEQGVREFIDSIRRTELAMPLRRQSPVLLTVVLPLLAGAVAAGLFYMGGTAAESPGMPVTSLWFAAALALWAAGAFARVRALGKEALAQERWRVRQRGLVLTKLAGGKSMFRPRPWRAVADARARFDEAVKAAPAVALSPAASVFAPEIYGLFKQQKDGDCNVPMPSMTRPRDVGKWRAWAAMKGVGAEEARARYVEVLDRAFDALDEAMDPEADRAADMHYARRKEKTLYRVRILGVGQYKPARVVSSSEVEHLCGVAQGWSEVHNVGVRERRWADVSKGETNSFMAAEAVRKACASANVDLKSLDCVINASASNERILPDGSTLVKRALGMEAQDCACFSVHATCLSFVVALDLAAALIKAGRYARVCIVSSEISSVAIDFTQPESALLLGDGAGAVVLGPTPRGAMSSIHAAHFENHCQGLDTATLRTGTLKHPKDAGTTAKDHLFDMDGPGIVTAIRSVGAGFLEKLRPGLSTRLCHDIDLVVPHQASGAAMDILVAHGWPREKTINILGEVGNCVAASTVLALCEAVESGRLRRGMKCLLCGTGGGITLGGMVLTY